MENQNLKRGVSRMERFAFDNFDTFDPEMFDPEMYDPSSATDSSYYDDEDGYDLPDGYNNNKPRMVKRNRIKSAPLAQLDIVIDNSAISASTTVELFNVLRSNTLIQNTTYNSTLFAPNTFDNLFLRATPASGQALSDAQLIYWDKLGNLVYNTTVGSAAAFGTALCKISCPQVPFRVLHEATRSNLLWIEKIRFSVKTAAQIDQPLNIFKNTFLGGTKSNQIAPRSEFKPNQFQSLIVDVPVKSAIDAETGMSYTLLSQEKVTLSCFFRFIRGNEYMVNEGF
jgi:hypothetical protein